MAQSTSLEGKVAIVTGAASGIGYATARLFLQAGVSGLTMVDIASDKLQAAAKELGVFSSSHVLLVTADTSDEEQTKHYVDATIKEFGRLDISYQNAGVLQERAPIEDTDVDTFDRLMRVNVRSTFLGMKHSIKAMKASPSKGKGCSIILTGSQLGLDGAPNLAPYSTSKFALRGLTACAAAELGQDGIRVNTICPGPIDTPMVAIQPKEEIDILVDLVKMKRLGKPEEIAQAVLFLASDQSSYMTGASLKVDGGFSTFA